MMNSEEEYKKYTLNILNYRKRLEENLTRANEKYLAAQAAPDEGKKEKKLAVAKNNISSRQHALEKNLLLEEFSRPATQEDISYRDRQSSEFTSNLNKAIPKDNDLFFHGCPIYAARDIIKSGGLSSSVDRIGVSTSYDVEDQVSVTTKDSLDITIGSYTGLNGEGYHLPAGCVFVFKPENEEDLENAKKSLLTSNTSFRDNPERLIAILSSKENSERLNEWCKNAEIDTSKVFDFDGFVKHLGNQRESSQIKSNADIMRPSLADRIKTLRERNLSGAKQPDKTQSASENVKISSLSFDYIAYKKMQYNAKD